MNPTPIFAYLDPGTLTFLMQCLVAAVIGGALSIRMFWTGLKLRIASLFGFRKGNVEAAQPDEGEPQLDVLSAGQESTVELVQTGPEKSTGRPQPESENGRRAA